MAASGNVMSDQLSREYALARVHEAGRKSGLWGAPATCNPYGKSAPAFQRESAEWLAGHSIGAAEKKADTNAKGS